MPKATQVKYSDIQLGDTVTVLLKSVGNAPQLFSERVVIIKNLDNTSISFLHDDFGPAITSIGGPGGDFNVEYYRLDNPSQTR